MFFNFQSFGLGFVSGFATGLVARELTSVTTSALKPVARAFVKTGVLAYERLKESVAHVGEAIEDIVAEVQVETAAEAVPAKKPARKSSKPRQPKAVSSEVSQLS